jgi:anti-sigma regulatory factor (Ser/Thr protein kinase)/Pyruvate/2-oxoacid:ferredoxin oxidoreductase delta subunit
MITMSCLIAGGDFDTAGLATRRLKEHLVRVGVGAAVMRRAMIASYEAEMNVVIHARTGTLWARLDRGKLDLEVADEGPGIPNVDLALREGWSTASDKAREMGFGAGMGLPNIRRNSDLFDIETRVGRGTRIRSTILLEDIGKPEAFGAPPAQAPGADVERCRKCLRCIFACPTGALRVHAQGPQVIPSLCVGCAACIGECSSRVYGIGHADAFRVPAPESVLVVPQGFLSALPVGGPDRVLAGLASFGFAEVRVLEEWMGAMRAEARGAARAGCAPLPLIPPVCPAVVSLIESRFPSLIPHLGQWLSPIEAAGEEFPLRHVYLLAACPAQYAAARGASLTERLTVLSPAGLSSAVLGADLAPRPAAHRAELRAPRGEPERIPGELVVTGVRQVMRVLAAAETGSLPGVTLLDLSLCEQGCSGSPLLTADPFLSAWRFRQWTAARAAPGSPSDAGTVRRTRPYAQRAGARLDPDMGAAIRALGRIDELTRALPGRDCGACGAPSCSLFAEDIVTERAGSSSCPFMEETR